MKIKSIAFLIALLTGIETMNAQTVYSIDASKIKDATIQTGHLKMGNPGPEGRKVEINNRYMTLNGKPIIPVMGEMHFTRVARDQWEDRILKMKACGITIVASYVIWIHHEEVEGQFEWSGDKDLKAFAALCKKHDLWFYPRIGPWIHAEVRNGGTPDWLLAKEAVKERSLNPVFQRYAEEWYRQIALQLKGFMYKDGGPVVGVQLENEYAYGKSGEPYIMWLKQTALKYGIDVPMYTVTGWGNGSVPPYEVIPLWGAYPDEPWATTLTRTLTGENFRFTPFRDDDKIGNEVGQDKASYLDYSAYPYFTCEMGVGIENTDHRRLVIDPIDGLGLVLAKLGSGSNLPGYYMFSGGSNPRGLLTSMEESQESGSYNTNPVISYDFQAAIRETGELNGPYVEIKKLHYFLNEFGDRLAPMKPFFLTKAGNMEVAVRASSNAAFVFGINYIRHQKAGTQNGVQFEVKLKDETVIFPEKPINIPDSAMFVWPVNFALDNVLLKYGTIQPLCRLGGKGLQQWVFVQDVSISPELCFSDQHIRSLTTYTGDVAHRKGQYFIRNLTPGTSCVINITDDQNRKMQIIILSKQVSKHVWLFKNKERKDLYLSSSGMYSDGDSIHLFGTDNHFTIEALKTSRIVSGLKDKAGKASLFRQYEVTADEQKPSVSLALLTPLSGSSWLATSVAQLTEKNILNHQFLARTFELNNTSAIRAADIVYFSDSSPEFWVNGLKVGQHVAAGQLSRLDLTGYLKKGRNFMMVTFPTEAGEKAFAANFSVLYQNFDKVDFHSDSTWLITERYVRPKMSDYPRLFKKPQIIKERLLSESKPLGINNYQLVIDNYDPGKLKDAIIGVNYAGDKARIYNEGLLRGDDFYNGTEWRISLNSIGLAGKQPLSVSIYPLSPDKRIYFDNLPSKSDAEKGLIHSVKLIPYYKTALLLLTDKN